MGQIVCRPFDVAGANFPQNYFDMVDLPQFTLAGLSEAEVALKQRENATTGASDFAIPKEVQISSSEMGEWRDVNGASIWRMSLLVPGATSLSIRFTGLDNLFDAQIFLRNGDGYWLSGPMDASTVPWEDVMYSDILPGQEMVIFVVAGQGEQPDFTIDKVNIGFAGEWDDRPELGEQTENLTSCQVDVTANQGDCYRVQQRSVCVILKEDNQSHCTGALINDWTNSFTPNLISAAHCFEGIGGISSSSARFRFKYWNGIASSGWITFVGATKKSSSLGYADFFLGELNQDVEPHHGLAWSGWTRETSAPSPITILHHIQGNSLKISRDFNPVNEPNKIGGVALAAGQGWRLDFSQTPSGDFGTVYGGSSGGPCY